MEACLALGIEEVAFYGFMMDSVKRPSVQTRAFQKACVDSVNELKKCDTNLLVIGNTDSKLFLKELNPYTIRTRFGEGKMKVNYLVNYGWNWHINQAASRDAAETAGNLVDHIASHDISSIDLILSWGGSRRLNGFLPIQSDYSDIYVIPK